MSKGKTFAKNSIVYALGKALTLLVSVFLLPLYTSKITPDNYGYFETTRTIIDLLIPFLCMEMWCGVFRLFFSNKNGKEHDPKKLFSSSFFYCTVIAILISLGFFVSGLIWKTKNWPLSIFLIFSTTYSLLLLYFARSLKKNLFFSISGVIASVTNGITGVVLVVCFNCQEEAMFLALSVGYLVQIVFLFFTLKLWKYVGVRNFSFKELKDIIKFSWPLGISTLLYFLSKGFIQILISYYLTDADVAFYSVSLRFTSIIVVFANVLSMSWMDIVFSEKDDIKRRELIKRWTPNFFKFFAIVSIVMIPLISIAFDLLVGEEYKSAYALLPFAIASTYFTLSGGLLINPLHSENRTVMDMVAKIISAGVAIATFFIVLSFTPFYAGIAAYLSGLVAEYFALHIICNGGLKLSIKWSPTVVYLLIFSAAIIAFVKTPISISFMIAILVLTFGIFYCWDVIKIVLERFVNNLPDSLFSFLKTKIKNNIYASMSLFVFFISFLSSLLARSLFEASSLSFSILISISITCLIFTFIFLCSNKKIIVFLNRERYYFVSIFIVPIILLTAAGMIGQFSFVNKYVFDFFSFIILLIYFCIYLFIIRKFFFALKR